MEWLNSEGTKNAIKSHKAMTRDKTTGKGQMKWINTVH